MLRRNIELKEIWRLQERWRAVYARRYHEATGRWVRSSDRHVFDRRYVGRFSLGPAAVAEYAAAEDSGEVFVVYEDGRFAEEHDCKPPLDDYAERFGATIFPSTLAWTAATGPDYFDPVCFARAEWVDVE